MENNLWVNSYTELMSKAKLMREFQLVHNELRKDFLSIYDLAKLNKEDDDSFKPMIRACVKELFMLIESDLYLINQWNPYPDFNSHDKFFRKFKGTFRQHALIFERENLRIEFSSRNFRLFSFLKELRDNITYPKGQSSIQVSIEDLNLCYQFYELYTKFIQALMKNVFVATMLPVNIV